jgi:hypothetical protein
MGLTGWCDVVVRGGGFDVVVMWCEEGLTAAAGIKGREAARQATLCLVKVKNFCE